MQLPVRLQTGHLGQILERIEWNRAQERLRRAVQPRTPRHLQPPALLDEVPVEQQSTIYELSTPRT